MERYDLDLDGERIHLALKGVQAAPRLDLHLAADVIPTGNACLWASVDMPDPADFPNCLSIYRWWKVPASTP
jgi:hypothetical protein